MRLVLATGNPGKMAELSRMLAGSGIEVLGQKELEIDSAPEDAATFVENALIKARHVAKCSGLPAVADDSGLVVPALGGEPGIYSARYAGRQGDDAANNQLLLSKLAGVENHRRQAAFHCVMVYLRNWQDPAPLLAHGIWRGYIVDSPRGTNGFGYDPLFADPQLGLTAAELDSGAKDARSHRGQALRELVDQLNRFVIAS
ncbi:RdgB/HAM1 family non-canonical purine NTP pyrophosphatase [Halorhodospira halochloris]|uniref:dITP/XTP pyrophosphatase n=1 Tax=Halorhodospira halochloris TaxID=1052 RepID=A0A0X8X6C6_HALHR|nr:RdgB/HAM1 family non-canonical purine NTP pyrophosphatase [Halorhodospira halochloris]MBK1651042.1 non-canonical purine NTP pyrophosphatase, RdgB/HAM1 family [Halorhodospira halochloris]MCG5529402.1 RdgB/HAM1 family non-canonical purine NTP pyrophosphatase [Halorhodospira halochloris]MCG5547385.1 RdgB/HAM1 family non-canonical purine NTP pyrophosphatase [Halorhodospira halochloris]BAU56444.1 nucleoside 5-triphosphatase RdgB (dHAPTP [Halorhodospira halochloris]